MTELSAANDFKDSEDAKVNGNNNNDEDNNNSKNEKNHVVTLQLEKFGEKVDGEVIIDTRDNWIGRFLYGGPVGLTINFGLLIGITLHFALTIKTKLEDDYYFENYFMQIWLRQFCEFWLFLVPLHLVYCALLVFVLFPLSRLSRSTSYYWFLGLSMLSFMFALLYTKNFYHEEITMLACAEAGVDWVRVGMITCSFLVECNRSKEVFDKSSMKTLAYFYFIPCLVYKHEYPRARSIRWVRVLSRLWWLLVAAIPGYAIALPLLPYFLIDIRTISFMDALVRVPLLCVLATVGYTVLVQFILFENFCGFHAELFRYPDLRLFGSVKKFFNASGGPGQVNSIASKWLKTYAFRPVVKATASRFKASLFTYTISYLFHDIVLYFATGICLSHITLITILGFSIGSAINSTNIFISLFRLALVGGAQGLWGSALGLEFLAWYYSSVPDVENERRLRFIPLFVPIVIERITDFVSTFTF